MAEAFNKKLAAAGGDNNDDVTNSVTRSLRSLGLESPVIAGAENVQETDYYRRLAKELGTVLLGSQKGSTAPGQGIMVEGDPKRELMGLDEVWCLWNRARGVGEYSSTRFPDKVPNFPSQSTRFA